MQIFRLGRRRTWEKYNKRTGDEMEVRILGGQSKSKKNQELEQLQEQEREREREQEQEEEVYLKHVDAEHYTQKVLER